jgi:hypothetical protein
VSAECNQVVICSSGIVVSSRNHTIERGELFLDFHSYTMAKLRGITISTTGKGLCGNAEIRNCLVDPHWRAVHMGPWRLPEGRKEKSRPQRGGTHERTIRLQSQCQMKTKCAVNERPGVVDRHERWTSEEGSSCK